MKLKRDDLMKLSPAAVADYLRNHRWIQFRNVEGKGTIWLYQDDKGDEFEIMLPNGPELGDFTIRMAETIQTLASVEGQEKEEVYSKLADQPSAIIDAEIFAEVLTWNLSEREKLKPLLELMGHLIVSGATGNLFEGLGDLVEILYREGTLGGSISSKETAIWNICAKILRKAGWHFKAKASKKDLAEALQQGSVNEWLEENAVSSMEPGRIE